MIPPYEYERISRKKEDCYMKKTSLVIMAAGIGSRFGGGIRSSLPRLVER